MCHLFVCPAEQGKCPITDRHEVVDNAERILIRADGSRLPILKSAMPMQFNGEEYLIESFIDISAIKRTEHDLREANDELQAFMYSAAHDLRQPLVNIKGFSVELKQSLQEINAITAKHSAGFAPEELQKLDALYQNDIQSEIGFIGSSVERMDGLINALLKLSQLGHRPLRPESIDMNALVRTIQESLTHQARDRNAVLSVADLPEVVADRTAMEQVMSNLLDNAVKYLRPDRPGVVEVSGERVNNEIVFQVKDNGRGISEADMPKLFRMFRRLGEQNTSGEGVGLAYVRSIVRKQGGRIWCESKQGEGSTFSFTIPAVQTAENRGQRVEDRRLETGDSRQ
jgi:signal transduction histidine kinase